MEATLTTDGQITLPLELRKRMHLSPGDTVKIFLEPDGHARLLPARPVSILQGILPSLGRPAPTIEEMDDAMAQAIAQHVCDSE